MALKADAAPSAADDTDQTKVTATEPAPTENVEPTSEPTGKTPDVAADPSSAPQAKSMVDAVKAALAPKTAVSPTAQTPDPKADTAKADPVKGAEDEDKDDPLSDDELKQLSVKTQRRFRHLNNEVKTRGSLIEQLTPKASEYDRLDKFVRDNGIPASDVRKTFEVAAMIRNDPMAAYQQLLPLMQSLEVAIGNVLPPELQQQVDAGFLTREHALALTRSASDAAWKSQRLERVQSERQQDDLRRGLQTQLDTAVQSVDSWETSQATKDPDWKFKQPEIAERLELLTTKKRMAEPDWVPTAQEALSMTQQAYADVTEKLKRFMPRPTEIRRNAAAGGTPPGAKPAPTSMLEAIRGAVAR